MCTGWEGSATIFTARLGVLEAYRYLRDGRVQPAPVLSSGSVQMVMDGVDDGTVLGRLNRKYLLCWAFLMRDLEVPGDDRAQEVGWVVSP